jgi:hypothetical protein
MVMVNRSRSAILALAGGAVLCFALAGGVLAASNPSGSGQPSQSCGSPTAGQMPNGFGTAGFTHAALVYAGSDNTASLNHAQSSAAVSQYDVACFQLSTNHH